LYVCDEKDIYEFFSGLIGNFSGISVAGFLFLPDLIPGISL
jgi:hypothetical protein